MFILIASGALAASPAGPSAPAAVRHSSRSADPARGAGLLPVAPWWEKITVTLDGDGKTQSCKYQSSSQPRPTNECALFSAGMDDSEPATEASERNEYTELTFERRFSPGAAIPADVPLATGDTLLGREVMAIAIDGRGKVTHCRMVATSGDAPPDYSCSDASAEHFTSAGKAADRRQGVFTVRIYGHSEHVTMRESHERPA
jgi:hypothetical protein